jgi:hypothetical protein
MQPAPSSSGPTPVIPVAPQQSMVDRSAAEVDAFYNEVFSAVANLHQCITDLSSRVEGLVLQLGDCEEFQVCFPP